MWVTSTSEVFLATRFDFFKIPLDERASSLYLFASQTIIVRQLYSWFKELGLMLPVKNMYVHSRFFIGKEQESQPEFFEDKRTHPVRCIRFENLVKLDNDTHRCSQD